MTTPSGCRGTKAARSAVSIVRATASRTTRTGALHPPAGVRTISEHLPEHVEHGDRAELADSFPIAR